MDWKEGFIGRVLAAVPAGSWRGRMEAELRDHLDSQCRALAEAGRTQDEARAEALRLMGEPEKLRLEYEAAWRRELRFSRPLCVSLLLYALAIILMGPVYLFGEFGKGFVGLYSCAAVPLAVVLTCVAWVRSEWKWTAVACLCMLCAAIQLPPLVCWIVFYSRSFYVMGVMVPGWVGVSVHFLLGTWGLMNFGLAGIKRRRAERRPAF